MDVAGVACQRSDAPRPLLDGFRPGHLDEARHPFAIYSTLRNGRAAPNSGPVLRGTPGSPCRDGCSRPLRLYRMVGCHRALHFSLPGIGIGSRHSCTGPGSRGPRYELGPKKARAPMVARRALAGVRVVAAGLHAHAQCRQRHEHLVGLRPRVGLCQRSRPCSGRPHPPHPASPEGEEPAANPLVRPTIGAGRGARS